MNKMDAKGKQIIALAWFHRYGWIAVMILCSTLWEEWMDWILCAGMLLFSVWSFVGYKRRWKHIFCSNQNAYHQTMTPHNVRWHQMKKSDAYGVPLVFFVLGVALLLVILMRM